MFKHIASILIALLIVVCTSCNKNKTTEANTTVTTSPNILLIIADDLGKDAIKGYTEGSIKPNTPNIDAIRTKGLMFTNFWSNPVCSPTRACILTGKYGYRTGVKGASDVLSTSETTLQKYINTNTSNKYATAIVGKWHLAGSNNTFNPESMGIDYCTGLIRGAVTNYYSWEQTEDGVLSTQSTYSTEAFTTKAIDWVAQQTKPWFLWLAYNAPHTPFNIPPNNMHSQGSLPAYATGMNATPYYMAAIEAMDFQIGRLLSSMSAEKRDNTTIVFIGDNGTVNSVAQSPYLSSKVKSTLYQGGINVPMFVSGKGVNRTGTEASLIDATDLYSTIAEIAGVSVTQINDSKSFKTLLTSSTTIRNFQYSEYKDGTDDLWAISNGKYKLIVSATGARQMFNLSADAYETINLLNSTLTTEQLTAKNLLETELNNIRK